MKSDLFIKNFYDKGFVVAKKVFSKKEIQSIFSQINSIKKKSIKVKNPNMHFTSDNKLNTIHDINKYVKSGPMINLSKSKKMLNIVENILGEKAKVRNIEFFLKPKKTGMRAPLHQDNYYWNIKNKKALNAWIACSKANFKNGGVYYYSGTHKGGLKKHILSKEPGSSQKIPQKYVNKKIKKTYPNLEPGDCIFHHCEIIHGSKRNNSNLDRIGLVISYKGNSAVIDRKKLKSYRKKVIKNLNFLKK